MVVYCFPVPVGDRQAFEVVCEECGKPIGLLSGEEVVALTTGQYGPVLCFDCEASLCPGCQQVNTGGYACTLCKVEAVANGRYFNVDTGKYEPLPL